MSEAVDQIARQAAGEAKAGAYIVAARLDDHLVLCRELGERNQRVLDGLSRRFWWLMGLIVTGQGAVIVMLLGRAIA